MNKKIKYEVCCGSVDDAYNAYLGGADQIELNSALFLGGLTPSFGLMKTVRDKVPIKIIAMIRPREGGFSYTDFEYESMKQDAISLLNQGADGLAFGFLNDDGTVNEYRTQEFVSLLKGKEAVFHRAVDVTPDIFKAVDTLYKLGITRVLTSGAAPTAILGADTIKSLISQFNGKIEILPGGGLNASNILDFVKKTKTLALHSSARKEFIDSSVLKNDKIFFGGNIEGKYLPEHIYKITDKDMVKSMVDILKMAGEHYE